MSELNRETIIREVAKHDIRWIRKNYYTAEFSKEMSVCALLTELTEYRKAQDKEKTAKLPPTLLTHYDKHYIADDKKVKRLSETLLFDAVVGKKILLLCENANSKNVRAVRKIFDGIEKCKVSEPIDLSQSIKDFINAFSDLSGKPITADFIFCCLSKATDANSIIAKLMYLVGHFGKDKVCVVYGGDIENDNVVDLVSECEISCDSYARLGL